MTEAMVSATWTLSIGDSIKATTKSPRLTSIRYNAQPAGIDGDTTRSIKPAKEGCHASLHSAFEEWDYNGTHGKKTDEYVLILDQDGNNKTATLERLAEIVVLNVVQTSEEQDTTKLQRKYKQLTLDYDSTDEDDNSADGEDSMPNPGDAFDYRHFIEIFTPKEATVVRNNDDTTKSRTISRPGNIAKPATKKKRPTTEVTQQATKRVKSASQQTNSKQDKPQLPVMKISRTATLPRDENIDSGELILENGDETPEHKRGHTRGQSSMSLALNGQLGANLGQRPISLHSAASSPASRIQSPALDRSQLRNEEEMDLGGDEYHMHEEEDGDVESLGLPSPVHERASSRQIMVDEMEDDDDGDSLVDDLEQAMADGYQAAMPIVSRPEEEESEEE